MNPTYWQVNGNTFSMMEAIPGNARKRLDPGIYSLMYRDDNLVLNKRGEKFSFPYKIYGKDDKFIDRVIKTWDMTKSSMGILLTGIKGTGKTVTAELIANKANLPVIVITHNHGLLMNHFISRVEQECVIVFDEFEKTFAKKEEKDVMLTIMDGVLNSKFRKMFLLTTNTMDISSNLIDRPGRIRYLRKYGNLPRIIVKEIVEDLLQKKEHYSKVIDFIDRLELVTIDTVKSVINEVNIHNEPPSSFANIFNVTVINPKFDVYIVEQVEGSSIPKEYKVASSLYVTPTRFDKTTVERGLILKTPYTVYGKITRVLSPNMVECTENFPVTEKVTDGTTRSTLRERKLVYKIEKKSFNVDFYRDEEHDIEGDDDYTDSIQDTIPPSPLK